MTVDSSRFSGDEVIGKALKTALAGHRIASRIAEAGAGEGREIELLWDHCSRELGPGREKTTVVAGIVWPSKPYNTTFDEQSVAGSSSGALAAKPVAAVADLDDATWARILEDAGSAGDAMSLRLVEAAKAAALRLSPTTAFELVKAGVASAKVNAEEADPELTNDGQGILRAKQSPIEAKDAITALASPPIFKSALGGVSTQSVSSVVSGLISGPRAAVAGFLNQLSYYTMKRRAGVVGVSLAENVLARLKPAHAIKLHLVGHSFGASLVTAAANQAIDMGDLSFFSLTLLQGAFSHNGLAGGIAPDVAGAFGGRRQTRRSDHRDTHP